MPLDSKVMLDQMDYALDCWCKAISRAQHDDLSDLGEAQLAELVSLLAHTIDRFAPTGSQYHTRAQEVLKAYSPWRFTWFTVPCTASSSRSGTSMIVDTFRQSKNWCMLTFSLIF